MSDVHVRKPLDWYNSWALDQQAKGISFDVDHEKNLKAVPVVLIDPTQESIVPISPVARDPIKDFFIWQDFQSFPANSNITIQMAMAWSTEYVIQGIVMDIINASGNDNIYAWGIEVNQLDSSGIPLELLLQSSNQLVSTLPVKTSNGHAILTLRPDPPLKFKFPSIQSATPLLLTHYVADAVVSNRTVYTTVFGTRRVMT